jgi:hypothetical protein
MSELKKYDVYKGVVLLFAIFTKMNAFVTFFPELCGT